MSVIVETSVGNITIDLFIEDCPIACKNFLKLCKSKYYNNCIFHNIQKNFLVQTGDPTGSGRGGSSIYGTLYGEQARFFQDEIKPHLRHKELGTVGMANRGQNMNGSQFYITTAADLDSLDDKFTIFGEVVEGYDTLSKINDTLTDKDGKPYQVIRIRHTVIILDPYPDPVGLELPDRSPRPIVDVPAGFLPEDFTVNLDDNKDPEKQAEIKEKLEAKEAANYSVTLELLQDIPDAEITPPDNVLFVCKLHPVTTEEDLELIFARFGTIKSCDIIRDHITNDSLCYGFIEYENKESAEEAYFKMNKVLIDDRRIHVDFSQSVAKVDWSKAGGWRNYFHNRAKSLSGHSKNFSNNNNNTKRKRTTFEPPKIRNPPRERHTEDNKGRDRENQRFRDTANKDRDNKERDRERDNKDRDNKDRERDYKDRDNKERDREREYKDRNRDREKDLKERDRDNKDRDNKDRDYKDRHRERDNKDRDNKERDYKDRDRERDIKDRERERNREKDSRKTDDHHTGRERDNKDRERPREKDKK